MSHLHIKSGEYLYCLQNKLVGLLPFTVGKDFELVNSLFAGVKLTKNADFDKYKYSGYGTRFDARGSFSLSEGSGFGKNVIMFGADMILPVHIDNKKKDILVLGKDLADGLDDTMLIEEKEYSINFTEQQKKYLRE